MKTHLRGLYDKILPLYIIFIWPYGTFYYASTKSVVGEKCLQVENLYTVVWKFLLILLGHQHNRWVELKESLRVQTHAQV
jgi:hypothetical protein